MSVRVGKADRAPAFPRAAKRLMGNTQLRQNVRRATDTIRGKRAKVVAEMADWEELRDAAHEIKEHALRHLDFYLEQFETNCAREGGQEQGCKNGNDGDYYQ